MLALAEWLLGRADLAQFTAQRCLSRAEAVGAPQSLATGWHAAMTTALFRGDIEQAEHFENMLQECLDYNEFEYVYMRPLSARTQLLTMLGRPEEAVRVATQGIEKARENQALAYSSVSLTALAEAQLAAGHLGEGLGSIEQALSHANSVGERVWGPESMRIKGRLLAADGHSDAAETCFRDAAQEAADRSLLALELRATIDLAKTLLERDHLSEAKMLIEGVLERYTEGFDTTDYLVAQSLLSSNMVPAAQ